MTGAMGTDPSSSLALAAIPAVLFLATSTAQGTVVGSAFFVDAKTSVFLSGQGNQLSETGPNGGPVAQNTNPITTSPSVNGQYTGGSGNASASANLLNGQLRAAAGVRSGYQFPSSATAAVGDTLYVKVLGASVNTITTVGFTYHVHGTQNVGYNNGAADAVIDVGHDRADATYGFYSTSANIINAFGTVKSWGGGVALTDEDITGSIQIKGVTATVPIELLLATTGQYGYVDFSNTGTFSLSSLPAGVTYTSASGEFLAGEAIPETPSLIVFATGLGLLFFGRKAGAA